MINSKNNYYSGNLPKIVNNIQHSDKFNDIISGSFNEDCMPTQKISMMPDAWCRVFNKAKMMPLLEIAISCRNVTEPINKAKGVII